MAINDIVVSAGDGQDFIVEIPAGNSSYVPADILVEKDGSLLSSEIPAGTSGNIFIMSE